MKFLTFEKLSFVLASIFSCIIIYVISFALLDEAVSRFGAISFSIIIIIFSNPLSRNLDTNWQKSVGWFLDFSL